MQRTNGVPMRQQGSASFPDVVMPMLVTDPVFHLELFGFFVQELPSRHEDRLLNRLHNGRDSRAARTVGVTRGCLLVPRSPPVPEDGEHYRKKLRRPHELRTVPPGEAFGANPRKWRLAGSG